MRAVDLHVHLPLPQWVEGSLGPYREPAERYFRSQIVLQTAEELAASYEAIDCVGVLLGWDAETATRLPRLSNDLVAEIVHRFPDRFVGFAGIDPWKGASALREMRRGHEELGLIGYKFHPSMQAFRPDDPRWSDLFERAAIYRAPCLFHTGTSGIGAGMPGGQGVELAYARPIHLDGVAARYPEVPVIMAHSSAPRRCWPSGSSGWHRRPSGALPATTPPACSASTTLARARSAAPRTTPARAAPGPPGERGRDGVRRGLRLAVPRRAEGA